MAQRWAILENLIWNTPLQLLVVGSLFEIVKCAFQRQWRCPSQMILIAEIFQVMWVERTMAVFQQSTFTFPVDHIVRHGLLQVKDLKDTTVSPRKLKVLEDPETCSLLS